MWLSSGFAHRVVGEVAAVSKEKSKSEADSKKQGGSKKTVDKDRTSFNR